MKTIIAGSRFGTFSDRDVLNLDELTITEVVCGMARGIDTEGLIYARERNIPVKQFPADWNKYGHAAGPMRNKQMAEYAEALAVFDGGKGTLNMIKQAKEHGLKIYDFRTVKK